MYSVKTADGGQGDCPKHAEFYSKKKFEKLVHLVVFIVRLYHDARSPERKKIKFEKLYHKKCYIHKPCSLVQTCEDVVRNTT